jgi:hypothetical protein
MTFDDLKQMEGQIIDYYEVKGNSIKAKKGKITKIGFYGGNAIALNLVDKLGRCKENLHRIIYYGGHYITKSTVYDCGYVKLFLNKEDSYYYVIANLRKQRQDINKKMLEVQMELYGKKTETKNEG